MTKPELKVVPIYEANFRDVPAGLERLKADCEANKVPGIVTVCFNKGMIDVRSLGEWSLVDAACALMAAHEFAIRLLREHMEDRSLNETEGDEC